MSIPSGSIPSGSSPSGSIPSWSIPSGSLPSASVPPASYPSASHPLTSYPPPHYTGTAGETSATLRSTAAPPDLVSRTGSADYLATGASTRGDFGLYRWNMGPEPSGPSAHFHRTVTESFFVLSGTVQLYDGSAWVTGQPGDFLHVPKGGLHGFRNESGEPARMLILFTPGAPREGYFEFLAEVGLSGRQPTNEEWTEFYLRHDTYWA